MEFEEWERPKDPNETARYTFDWTDEIGTDTDQVLAITAVPLDYLYKDETEVDANPLQMVAIGPVKTAQNVVTNKLAIFFSGGTLDRDYPVRLQVTLDGEPNQILEQTMILKIRDR